KFMDKVVDPALAVIHDLDRGVKAGAFGESRHRIIQDSSEYGSQHIGAVDQRDVEVENSEGIDAQDRHSQLSSTCAPAASRRISKTTNSMGAAIATPTSQISCPRSMTGCGLLVSSHFT